MTQMMETEMLLAPVAIPNAAVDTWDEFLYGPAIQFLPGIYLLVKMLGAGLAEISRVAVPVYMGCECLFAHIPARI